MEQGKKMEFVYEGDDCVELYYRMFTEDINTPSHNYNCWCYDGFAVCEKSQANKNEADPPYVLLCYPKKVVFMQNEAVCRDALEYRLGYTPSESSEPHYGDIMFYASKRTNKCDNRDMAVVIAAHVNGTDAKTIVDNYTDSELGEILESVGLEYKR